MPTCPECEGKGFVSGIACPPGKLINMPCSLCGGHGEITETMIEQIEQGKALRASRLERDESLSEAAKRLGISPQILSRVERGMLPASELEHK